MATSIERVRRAVAREAWAILPEKLEQICEFLALRADGRLSAEEIQAATAQRRTARQVQANGVAVLPIYGTISQRMDMLSAMSGGTSTESVGAAFDRMMADADIGTIILDVDSPGGTVPGVMELSDKIYKARGKGKRIIAVANSMAASAAYWIATAADELVVTPSGMVGSVGVYTIHLSYAGMLEVEGVEPTIIKAGEHKAEGNPYEKLPEDARAYTQSQIDEIYGEFVGAVARNRGLSRATVEADFGQGRAVKAKPAVKAGMADRVATLEQVLKEVGVNPNATTGARMDGTAPTPAAAAHEVERVATGLDVSGDTLTSDLAGVSYAPIGADTSAILRGVTIYRAEENHEEAQDTADVPEAASEEASHAPITEPAPEAKEQAMPETSTAAQNGAAQTVTTGTDNPGASVTHVADFRAERERAKAITELCEMHGITGEAADHIESGASVNEVVAAIKGRARENLAAMKASHVQLSEKEQKSYSVSRAILAAAEDDWARAGFEREVHEQIRSNLPKDYKSRGGFMVPLSALNAGSATAGGNLVFTQEGDFIDMLRNRMKIAELGATILTGLEGGTIAFPKQTGAGTWSWVAENPGSDMSDSDATVGQVLLAPKSGASTTAFSRQLLNQSSINAEQFVRNDLDAVAALGIDAAAIAGTGSNNQPTGILNTSGIGSVAGGTNGAVPTYDNLVDLETAVATENADIGALAYLTTPGIRGALKKTQVFSGTNGAAVWTGGMQGEANGYPAHVSNQVPSNLTKGTAAGTCHAIIFGVWSQLLLGYWGAAELVVDPYTKKKQQLIEVTAFQMVGLAVRHAESFAAMKDALPAAA